MTKTAETTVIRRISVRTGSHVRLADLRRLIEEADEVGLSDDAVLEEAPDRRVVSLRETVVTGREFRL